MNTYFFCCSISLNSWNRFLVTSLEYMSYFTCFLHLQKIKIYYGCRDVFKLVLFFLLLLIGFQGVIVDPFTQLDYGVYWLAYKVTIDWYGQHWFEPGCQISHPTHWPPHRQQILLWLQWCQFELIRDDDFIKNYKKKKKTVYLAAWFFLNRRKKLNVT